MKTASEGYAASRADAALFDFDFRASLLFTGPDRTSFLHNLLSNDIKSLRPGTGCYTTLLTQQSKVVADANVFSCEDLLRFDVDRGLKDRAREHLEKFLVADEVEIEDPSEGETVIGILGPRAAAALGAVGVEAPAGDREHRRAEIAGIAVTVARVDWSVDPGFQIVVARADAARLRAALGIAAAERADLEILRLEAGIPWPGIDFDESRLVLEAGLERGIHFKKGCYLGQEVVERASARGHVNRRLVGLSLEGDRVPPRAARIFHGADDVGEVTSAAFSPTLARPIALGYVRREVMEPGNRLTIDGGIAEVARLPFR